MIDKVIIGEARQGMSAFSLDYIKRINKILGVKK